MAISGVSEGYQSGAGYQSLILSDSFQAASAPQSADSVRKSRLSNGSSFVPSQSTGSPEPERDSFELSPQMQAALDKAMGVKENETGSTPSDQNSARQTVKPGKSGASKSGKADPTQSARVQKYIAELKAIDNKVHAHEAAHLAAAGNLARGGASYKYQTGPDGKKYAVSGEVNIDTKPVDGDAKATLIKAMRIQRAALAPADPSGQDRAVASAAASMAAQAQAEISRQASAVKKPASSASAPESPIPVSQPAKSVSSNSSRLYQTNQAPLGATRFDLSA